jgi:hypothetical protein
MNFQRLIGSAPVDGQRGGHSRASRLSQIELAMAILKLHPSIIAIGRGVAMLFVVARSSPPGLLNAATRRH